MPRSRNSRTEAPRSSGAISLVENDHFVPASKGMSWSPSVSFLRQFPPILPSVPPSPRRRSRNRPTSTGVEKLERAEGKAGLTLTTENGAFDGQGRTYSHCRGRHCGTDGPH